MEFKQVRVTSGTKLGANGVSVINASDKVSISQELPWIKIEKLTDKGIEVYFIPVTRVEGAIPIQDKIESKPSPAEEPRKQQSTVNGKSSIRSA
jgi:hypothetical protein